jgi:exodeoxyribonuclease VII small subunit
MLEGGRRAPPKIDVSPFRMPMPPSSVPTPASYEAALEELEQLIARIESGQLPLEQLLTGYQRGAQLLQFCRDKLQAVEHQIKVLDEGTLKPWLQE